MVDEVDISNDDERSLVVDVLLIVDLVCLAFSTWAPDLQENAIVACNIE